MSTSGAPPNFVYSAPNICSTSPEDALFRSEVTTIPLTYRAHVRGVSRRDDKNASVLISDAGQHAEEKDMSCRLRT